MSIFRDLSSAKAIYFKGILFVVLAIVAAALLIMRLPQWDTVLLLSICVWASCRAYYFAFYVIEKYVDPEFRFSGLIDFARYLLGKQTPK